MTLKLKLTSTFTDLTLPKFQLDPVLPEAGGLLLVDFAHPADSAPIVGLPTINAVTPVTNLAAAQAKAMIAGASDAQVAPQLSVAGGVQASGLAKFERSGKGGLHLITSQASDPTTAAGINLYMPDTVKQYLLDNPSHNLYVSTWTRVTRQHLPTASSHTTGFEFTNATVATSNLKLLTFADAGPNGVGTPGGNAGRWPSSNPVAGTGLLLNAASGTGWTGTAPTTVNNLVFRATLGCTTVYSYTAALRQSFASRILYRVYVEDLTVSGRTYAQVDALDNAQFTKDVNTAGGRFYGDTYTNPTTLP